MSRNRSRLAAVCLTLAATVIVPTVTASARSSSDDWAATRSLEAAALAIPSAVNPAAADESKHVTGTIARAVRVAGSSGAPVTCDHCTGRALTLQFVYAYGASEVTADNAASAWASGCRYCAGWAVSLQIVVVRSTAAVTAGNRALAVNASCAFCRSAAAAVQLVVVVPSDRTMTNDGVAQLMSLRDELLRELPAPPLMPGSFSPSARAARSATAAITATAVRIQSLVSSELHATAARHDVRVRG